MYRYIPGFLSSKSYFVRTVRVQFLVNCFFATSKKRKKRRKRQQCWGEEISPEICNSLRVFALRASGAVSHGYQ